MESLGRSSRIDRLDLRPRVATVPTVLWRVGVGSGGQAIAGWTRERLYYSGSGHYYYHLEFTLRSPASYVLISFYSLVLFLGPFGGMVGCTDWLRSGQEGLAPLLLDHDGMKKKRGGGVAYRHAYIHTPTYLAGFAVPFVFWIGGPWLGYLGCLAAESLDSTMRARDTYRVVDIGDPGATVCSRQRDSPGALRSILGEMGVLKSRKALDIFSFFSSYDADDEDFVL